MKSNNYYYNMVIARPSTRGSFYSVIADEHAITSEYKHILQKHQLLINRNSDKEGKINGRKYEFTA